MRFPNNFPSADSRKWQLARNENLTADGSLYSDFSYIHQYLSDKLGVEKNYVCLTNGAEEAVRICLSTPEYKKRLYFTPTWGLVSVLNHIYGDEIIEFSHYANYQEIVTNSSEMIKELNKGKALVYIANPNTPTGSRYDILQLINIIKEYQTSHFIIDESYFEFNEYKTVIKYFENLDNLTIIRNFSKAHGLANKRFGCYITKNKTMIDLRPANPCAENTIKYVIESYTRVEDMVNSLNEGKKMLSSYFKQHTKVLRTYTNFIVLEYKEKIAKKLERISYFHTFTVNGVEYIKLTALPDTRVKEFINDLER